MVFSFDSVHEYDVSLNNGGYYPLLKSRFPICGCYLGVGTTFRVVRAKTIGVETFTLFSRFLDRVQSRLVKPGPDREISKKEKFKSSFEGSNFV